MCYSLAPIWLQELPEGWQSLPSDCIRGSTPDFLLECALLALALPTQGSAAVYPVAGGLVRGHQAYPHTDVPAVQTGSLWCPVDVCRHEEVLHGACYGEALY